MEEAGSWVEGVLDFLRGGYGELDANPAKALLIALAATVFLQKWRSLIPTCILATVVHILVGMVTPLIVGGNQAFALPPLVEPSFWLNAASIFVGYLIIIAALFALKRLLLKAVPAKAGKAH